MRIESRFVFLPSPRDRWQVTAPTTVTGGAPVGWGARCLPRGVAGCEVGYDGRERDFLEETFGLEHSEGDVLHEGMDAHDHIWVVEVQPLGHLPGSPETETPKPRTLCEYRHMYACVCMNTHTHRHAWFTFVCVAADRRALACMDASHSHLDCAVT